MEILPNISLKKIKHHFDNETSIFSVVLANPPVNALSYETRIEIKTVLQHIINMKCVKEVHFKNEGKYFSAGADIKNELHPIVMSKDFHAAYRFSKDGQELMRYIKSYPKKITAMIDGYAFGGGLELALACHEITASPRSIVGLPEVTLGLIPGWGGKINFHLKSDPYLYPFGYVCVTEGVPVTVNSAFKIKVIDHINQSEEPDLLEIPSLRKSSPLAEFLLKKILYDGREYSEEENFEREAILFAFLCTQQDAREGIRAFIEKREPQFKSLS